MTPDRECYQEYIPGRQIQDAFDPERIPLLQMQHLRQLDFPITRRISYERTVDEFLLQLAVNDALRGLRSHRDMVILLNEEGALIRENGQFSLLFPPNPGELLTLAEDAPLYPVYMRILEKEKEGKVCRIAVPERSLPALLENISPFVILDEYCKKQPGGYLAVAERIVFEGPQELFSKVPFCRYDRMTTVDKDEIENYHTIKALFDDYIAQRDMSEDITEMQPLSVAVFGPPGSGKSFGVKQIAKSCGRFRTTTLNLSQYSDPADLFRAVHEVLHGEGDGIPLIFFDEFDSELGGIRRGWMKYFLAPMQDGEYTLDGRVWKTGAAVFVFAGATAYSFHCFLPHGGEEEEAFRAVKGPDFVSRLKGVLNVKGPNPSGDTDRSHIIRRAMLLRSQIILRFPGICQGEGKLVNISRGLLSALLTVSEYRHGSRSVEFILGMSRLSGISRFTPSCLPMDEQLDIHLNVRDFRRKLAFEQMMGDMVNRYAQIAHEAYRKGRLEEARREAGDAGIPASVFEEPEMADWNDLDEFYKEGHRSQLRYLGEKLQSYHLDIGLRPILEGAADTVTELYGPILEELAEIEHERWLRDKRADGWRPGPKNDDLRLSPEMVPYAELEPMTKEMIRRSVRNVPEYLKELGYELYWKAYRKK
ncbi:MAG: AAA family ATPase [Clostridium sp.]|nr:AAA family ATPase [Clostridium sp.]